LGAVLRFDIAAFTPGQLRVPNIALALQWQRSAASVAGRHAVLAAVAILIQRTAATQSATAIRTTFLSRALRLTVWIDALTILANLVEFTGAAGTTAAIIATDLAAAVGDATSGVNAHARWTTLQALSTFTTAPAATIGTTLFACTVWRASTDRLTHPITVAGKVWGAFPAETTASIRATLFTVARS